MSAARTKALDACAPLRRTLIAFRSSPNSDVVEYASPVCAGTAAVPQPAGTPVENRGRICPYNRGRDRARHPVIVPRQTEKLRHVTERESLLRSASSRLADDLGTP
jgi:hypothetical protein